MSLKPSPIEPVPEATARVARAAFRKGNPLLKLRDGLGTVFADADFADLFPKLGRPGLPPWRLALITPLQFRENLPDRQAAEAVRARIDWKYLLGLELIDPGFDHSVLCEFRARLLEGGAEERLLHKLLEACQARGLLKARGRQRTDATHVLASIRTLNRLELRNAAPRAWYERYALRVEDGRLPRTGAEREAYARAVGEDGFALLDRLGRPETAAERRGLPKVMILRQVWARQLVREDGAAPGGSVRPRAKEGPPPEAEPIASPYDPEARPRTRSGASWVGYIVHLGESCEDDGVHLITHAVTTAATVHEAGCTAAIHAALAGKGLVPGEHLVAAAYVDAGLLAPSREELGVDPVGPPRSNPPWRGKVEGGHTLDRFEADRGARRVRCPRGRPSSAWSPQVDHAGAPYVPVLFRQADRGACPARPLCTRAGHRARHLKLPPRAEHEALGAARERLGTKEGRHVHARRAGVEGTISRGVRAFGLRRSRYRGLARTHLQHVATAAAVDRGRLSDWFRSIPRAVTRTSRFAALAA